MTDHTTLRPAPGSTLSPGPWTCSGDGTIFAADGAVVCVLGSPFVSMTEQDITNGAAILALPRILDAFRAALVMLSDERDQRQFGGNGEYVTDIEALVDRMEAIDREIAP